MDLAISSTPQSRASSSSMVQRDMLFSAAPAYFTQGVIFSKVSKGLFTSSITTCFWSTDGTVRTLNSKAKIINWNKTLKKNHHYKKAWKLLPSGKILKVAIEVSVFAEAEIARKVRGSGCKFAASLWDGASNISGFVRNAFWIHDTKSPNPGVVSGIGYTSAMGIGTGIFNILNANKSFSVAQKINDVVGKRLAKLSFVRGVLESLTGLVMAGVRTLSLSAIKESSKAVATASSVLGNIAGTLSVLSFSIFIYRFSRILSKAMPLLNILKKNIRDEVSGYDHLSDFLNLSDEEKANCINSFDQKSNEEKVIISLENNSLNEEEKKVLKDKDYDMVCEKTRDPNVRIYLLKELSCAYFSKEAEYKRIIGEGSLNKIKEAVNAGNINDFSVQGEIVALAKKELTKQIVKNSILLFAALLGVASFIITTVATGGTVLVAGYIMMMIMNLIMTAADTETLINNVHTLKKFSTKEKVVLIAMMVLTIAITAVGAFFSGGGVFLLIAIAVGVAMLSVQGAGFYYASKKTRIQSRSSEDVERIDTHSLSGVALGHGSST